MSRLLRALWTTALLGAWALTSCDGDGPTDDPTSPDPAPAPGVILEFGSPETGVYRVLRRDFAPLDAWLRELDPTMGRKYRARELLDQHLLPLAMARVDFAAAREALEQRAGQLAESCGNAIELRRQGALHGGAAPDAPLTLSDMPLALAAWALRPEHVGAASPPLETARGFMVFGLEDILAGTTSVMDRAVGFLVSFDNGSDEEFARWLAARKTALGGQVTYVHPDLEGALPAWLAPR